MDDIKPICFFIMPFTPESQYLYIFLKEHIEKKHNIHCERADDQVSTKPLFSKIFSLIQKSDIIIADCSDCNPNVLYELGIAHNSGKEAILITKDPISNIPSDLKHYEFISYEKLKPKEFLEKLDYIFNNLLNERFENLYKEAEYLFDKFVKETHANVIKVKKDEFVGRVKSSVSLPSLEDENAIKIFVLPKIIPPCDAPISLSALEVTISAPM